MDKERWERVQAVFHRAAELDQPAQGRLLEEECGSDLQLADEVRRMLAEDARASLLDREVTGVANEVLGGPLWPSLEKTSPYRIRKVLGEGGMGVVYLAERSDLGNLVAIKILREGWASPERRRRFMAEQRLLSRLNHPSVARLYDASTLSDGTPWFVMEYVDGVPLTEYCRQHDCPVEERLRLIRAVAEAVRYAHGQGVVHRDLKPSNILVKPDGSVRLLDFGIAKQLDSPETTLTRAQFRPMTPAYASPEQLRGETVGVATDVYSLGVVLYELLTGKLPFDLRNKTPSEAEALIKTAVPESPSAAAKQIGLKSVNADLNALCLTAMQPDAARRYPSAAAFLSDIDRYLRGERVEARHDFERSRLGNAARRYARSARTAAAVLVLVLTAIGVTLAFSKRTASLPVHSRAVAVLPFQNSGSEHDVDYLGQALPEEIWRTLSDARSLSLRPLASASKYAGPDRDAQKAGRELHVSTIASGHFWKAAGKLQVTMELTDVETGRVIWSDVFDVPAENMVAMQGRLVATTRRAMAPVLGAAEFVTNNPPAPVNEEAYRLYLQASDLGKGIVAHENYQKAIDMLQKSVALDPSYAPAWELLSGNYLGQIWWANGGEKESVLLHEAKRRAIALDPDNVVWQADWLYQSSQPVYASAPGAVTKGAAYRGMADLLRKRPDIARVHFMMSWLLRDVGMLDDAARECEASVLIDAEDAGARSCGVVFLLRGDYARAHSFLNLDPEAEVSKAMTIDTLLREGKHADAERAMDTFLPQWSGYDMVRAYLDHKPAEEVAALARTVQPASDPEINYFSAAHLAYVGQSEAALAMLQRTIDGGYCAFPAAKSDSMFASVVGNPGFRPVEEAGMACRARFQSEIHEPR